MANIRYTISCRARVTLGELIGHIWIAIKNVIKEEAPASAEVKRKGILV